MLAEVFADETGLPDRLDLILLYKTFWKKKSQIYLLDKCNADSENKNYDKIRKTQESAAIEV